MDNDATSVILQIPKVNRFLFAVFLQTMKVVWTKTALTVKNRTGNGKGSGPHF
jgi:hypothetical protein